ncbi:hypothetical protein A8C32_10190 [Flavivirga aquatica]|uniref:Lipocalin-like domain-containing protein n=1 Tax=Flavivirga aquatica TaxID=1849968 RepID=A0A1E5TER6_9FLAO|nr:lipocalin family protein [Flavivirga aquatica]OEK09870.1 hypothetical protein A8C32_10190 [Flavivirga aquatica]
MKNPINKLSNLFIVLILFHLTLTSCTSNDDSNAENNEELSQNVIATKKKLVGDWKLVSSTINSQSVSASEFECLKRSIATFTENNTYNITFKKKGSESSNICSQTNTESGTYNIIDLNSITFFNSTSEIKLVNETLEITSKININNSEEQTQVDIFIRSDSNDLDDDDQEETDDLEIDDDETIEEEENTYDGTAIIAKLLGKWKIDTDNNECLQKNTIEFKTNNIFEFIQHKSTFNRSDLINYNINISYPFSKPFSASVTKGNVKVAFDTNADCQFIKKSEQKYIVKDEKTIALKNIPQVKILIENDTTINLIYEYIDSNSNNQTIEFVYKKI